MYLWLNICKESWRLLTYNRLLEENQFWGIVLIKISIPVFPFYIVLLNSQSMDLGLTRGKTGCSVDLTIVTTTVIDIFLELFPVSGVNLLLDTSIPKQVLGCGSPLVFCKIFEIITVVFRHIFTFVCTTWPFQP